MIICPACGLYGEPNPAGLVHWHPKPGEPGFVCPGSNLHGYPAPMAVAS